MSAVPGLFAHPIARSGLAALVLVGCGAMAKAGESKPTTAQECPQVGTGFMRLPGSDTCIQVGGAVQLSVGRGTPLGNAPNQGPQVMPTSPTTQTAVDPWKQAR